MEQSSGEPNLDYGERDLGKVDIVEIVCHNCGESQMAV